MRLKSLEINGFKSFADKTVIDFHSGVTGIVGPNGCGKSNVVDAVRWVLGETSAKALRGGEMADVIFNGTDKRKPLGMAEVTLTFSDCEKALGVDFNEVSISRRVFRDGRGEYELNHTPCRMKDIARMFMDTGVGRNMYSIMEQGKIDMLLSAKPEDRRQVFEEAAGITKSKAEKKEALRKLEYTEANLLRVTDILTEMRRQIGSAQRQAAKARRFQELHRDVVVLDTHLHFKRYSDLGTENSELETSIQSLRLRQADLEHGLEKEERELSESRAELGEMEAQISSLRHQLNQIQGQINAATHRISFNGERTVELQAQIEKNETEISASQERLLEQEQILARIRQELEGAQETLMQRREAVEMAGRQAMSVREERAVMERQLQEARQAVHTAEGIIISAQAEIGSHSAQAETDRQRQEQLQRDLNLLEEERAAKFAEEEDLKSRIEELTAEVEFLTIELHNRERECQETESELEVTQRRIRERHRAFSERQSKLEVLRQLVTAGEGLESGTQHALKAGQGSLGLVSTFLEVENGFIPAIESALGATLQAVLMENSTLATELIEFLTAEKMGTALLVPQDFLRRDAAAQMQTLPEGATTWALDKVRIKDQVRPLIHQLLANVLVVPDLATAVRLRQGLADVAFATLAGEFISSDGTIRGGAGKDAAASILQRQAELKELEVEAAELEQELAGLETQRDEMVEKLRAARSGVEEQREILQTRRVGESTLSGQLSLVQRESAQFASKLEGIQWEHGELLKRQEALVRKVDDATHRRSRAEEDVELRRQQTSELVELLEVRRRDETEAVDALNEARTNLAVEQRHLQALEEQSAPMQSRMRELEEGISRRRSEMESCSERIAAAEDESEALQRGMDEAKMQVEEMSQVLETRSAERSERAQQLSGRESALNQARRQISKLAEQRGSEEVRSTQISLRMENLANYAQERYRVSLQTFEVDAHALLTCIASQKAARSKVEKRRATLEARVDAEMAGDYSDEAEAQQIAESSSRIESIDEAVAAEILNEEGPDWEFVELVVQELKQRLDSMGPVNLDAIQEYEELEERHNFLQREYNDLTNSKNELLEIIQRINTESKRRFVETFYKVRDNFRNTFKELFGQAGQADLVLVSEEDPLESGIEVIAKPPGKKPTSITLLSGGERSMTAVALLFSIYMVKPSPFCILDELDAPLDESNIGRFLRMLDKFIENSQFVIVTHNKRTMRRADVLYGVTMEEFGVSKPVGMKMSDKDREDAKRRDEDEIAKQDAVAQEAEARLQAEVVGVPAEPPSDHDDSSSAESYVPEETERDAVLGA